MFGHAPGCFRIAGVFTSTIISPQTRYNRVMNLTKAELEVDRLRLCSDVIELTLKRLKDEMPPNPEEKAEILFATENLARSAGRLLFFVNETVWPPSEDDEEDE